MLTIVAVVIGYVVLFGPATPGLAVLAGIIVDSVKFSVTFGKGKQT